MAYTIFVRENPSMRAFSYLFIPIFILSGCTSEPAPINYGQDGCAYCRMTIVEDMYGAVSVNSKGKSFKYDSIECLAAAYLDVEAEQRPDFRGYVTDFENAPRLMPLDSAIIVQAKRLRSPMGLNLSAHSDAKVAASVAELYYGEIMDWGAVVLYVKSSWNK